MARDSARDARRLLRPLREETLALAQALVRVDTVAIPPDGHETAAQKRLASALRRRGIDVELYDMGFLERSRHPSYAGGGGTEAATTSSRACRGRGAAGVPTLVFGPRGVPALATAARGMLLGALGRYRGGRRRPAGGHRAPGQGPVHHLARLALEGR